MLKVSLEVLITRLTFRVLFVFILSLAIALAAILWPRAARENKPFHGTLVPSCATAAAASNLLRQQFTGALKLFKAREIRDSTEFKLAYCY
jgi:hypothetical protein